MIRLMLYSFLYFTSVGGLSGIKFYPASKSLDADIHIDIEKGYLLQRVGVFSPTLQNAIVHTLVPLHSFCQSSPTSEVCQRPSQSKEQNTIELGIVMSSRPQSILASQYKTDDVSKLINKNINEFLLNYPPGELVSNLTTSFHFFNNNFYVKPSQYQSLKPTTGENIVATQQVSSYFSKFAPTAVIQQIIKNQIGFKFLSDEESSLFLYPLMSSIDKSYAHSSVQELMSEFSKLIIAQSMQAYHSCSIIYNDRNPYPPCILVSTFFASPPPSNSFTYSVYKFYPLPVVVNQRQYTYSSIPKIFGLNMIDKTLAIWNDNQQNTKCSFSKVVLCEEGPTYVSLSSMPCIKQLLSTDESIVNACEISQTAISQPAIINILEGIWVFYKLDKARQCNMYANMTDSIGNLNLDESSILRLPCQTSVECSDIHFKSTACTETTITIKQYQSAMIKTTSAFQHSLKKLANDIHSAYKAKAIDSLNQLQQDLNNSNSTGLNILYSTGNLLIYLALLIVFTLIMAVMKFIQRKISNNINKIERQLNKCSDIFSIDLETV